MDMIRYYRTTCNICIIVIQLYIQYTYRYTNTNYLHDIGMSKAYPKRYNILLYVLELYRKC